MSTTAEMNPTNVPDLDSLSMEDLEAFASKMTVRRALDLFPDKPKGFLIAADNLRLVAWWKLCARQHERAGNKNGAAKAHDRARKIARFLPPYAMPQ